MGRVVGTPQLRRDRKNRKVGVFYVYWTDSIEGSKELSTRKRDYPSAKRFFDRWWKINLGVVTSRAAEEILIDEILEDYFDNRKSVVEAPERLKYAKKALLTYWAGKPVSSVNRWSCKEYEEFRIDAYEESYPEKEPLSVNTVRRELVTLRAALNMAYKDKVFDRETFVFLPSEKQAEIEYFKCDEAIGLIRASREVKRAKDHIRLFLQIGFLTGRRKQAILSLKRDHIDFEANIIRWGAEVQRITNKRQPTARLPLRLKNILLRHFSKFPEDEYVITYQGSRVLDIKTAFKAVVEAYREHVTSAHFQKTGKKLSKDDILRTAYPHMMRHSSATWLMQRGKKPKDVAEFLGMSEETLRRRYYHHHPDFQKDVADEL